MRYCATCSRHMRQIEGGKWQCTDIRCQAVFHNNPLPVSVLMVPIRLDSGMVGLFMIVRGQACPGAGQKAFPGGYQERGETSRQAAVRELCEETGGLAVDPEELSLAGEAYAPTPNAQLLFWLAQEKPESWLQDFRSTDEAIDYVVLPEPVDDIAFPSHAEMARKFFEERCLAS